MFRTIRNAFCAVALMGALSACGDTQAARQESADQIFGIAKVSMNVATVVVGGYNVLCEGDLKTADVCASHVVELVNSSMAGAADSIKSAEAIFAAGNTSQGERLDYAKAAMSAVGELTNLVIKYGLTKLVSQ